MGHIVRAALLASASLLVLMEGAAAQTPPPQPTSTPLDDITVTATRTEERAVDALAAVSVKGRNEIQTRSPQRIGSLVSEIPGVSTQENPNDPASAINIRGLQDFGRVAVTVDGARQNFQRSGHNADGAFFLDPAFIRSIDVTRGPVANIFGAGAIGGVVSFETIDPKDILAPGETVASEVGVTGLIGGRQTGAYGHGVGAVRPADSVSALIGLSFRNLNAYKDGGGNLIADSGQELLSGLGKLVLSPADGHTLKLTGQLQRYEFANGPGTPTSPRRSNDVQTSNFVAKYTFSQPDNDWANPSLSFYRTTTDTNQSRVSGASAQVGQSRYFRIETLGFDAYNTSRFALGPVNSALTFGVDGFQDRVRTFDAFSNGDELTPSGQRRVFGGFIEDRLTWNRFDLIGALRFDTYDLSGNGTNSSGSNVSPKVTLGYSVLDGVTPYISYATGYRPPAITETLISGLHPIPASFLLIPNPSLRPEVGRTFEVGANLKFDDVLAKGDKFRGKLSVFENRVSNYIESIFTDPGNDCGNPFVPTGCDDATFTYQNVARARLRGIEGELAYDAKSWFAAISGSLVRGDNLTRNQPLESIYPDKLTLSGGLRFLDEKLVFNARLTLVAAQDRLPAIIASPNAIRSAAYGLVDAGLTYEVSKDTRIFITGENLGDVRYRRYRDGDFSPGIVTKIGFTTRLGQ